MITNEDWWPLGWVRLVGSMRLATTGSEARVAGAGHTRRGARSPPASLVPRLTFPAGSTGVGPRVVALQGVGPRVVALQGVGPRVVALQGVGPRVVALHGV